MILRALVKLICKNIPRISQKNLNVLPGEIIEADYVRIGRRSQRVERRHDWKKVKESINSSRYL